MNPLSFVFANTNDLFALFNALPTIKTILDASGNADDMMRAIKKAVPVVVPIVEGVAEKLFPEVAVPLRLAAGVMAAFDGNKTLWLQKSINALVPGADLAEDGIYGPNTRDGVAKLQAQLGLKVDGWAGFVTNTAIQFALNALFGDKPVEVGTALGGTITPEKPSAEAPRVSVPAPPTVPRPGGRP